MKLYKDFYENFMPMDSGFKTLPQLILLCEDENTWQKFLKLL